MAPVVPGGAWREGALPDVGALSPEAREVLASAWAGDARQEHAAVATFARLSLELLALGAPSDLVEASQRASLDEVRHARLCFSLASAYANTPCDPGPLPQALSPFEGSTLASIAHDALHDGCVGEGASARGALAARVHTRDAAVGRVLDVLAEDEARHAALAWRVVDWCLAEGGLEVGRAVVLALDTLLALPASSPEAAPPELAAHGRLSEATQRALHAQSARALARRLDADPRVLAARAAPLVPVRSTPPRTG